MTKETSETGRVAARSSPEAHIVCRCQECDPSAESSLEWMAAFAPPPGLSAAPSEKRRRFAQTMGSTS